MACCWGKLHSLDPTGTQPKIPGIYKVISPMKNGFGSEKWEILDKIMV
jgi:hypothetical protein